MLKSQNKLTKICVAAVITASVCTAAGMTGSTYSMASKPDNQISVQNIAISDMTNSLTRSGSTMNCTGKTVVNSGYKANVAMELQQYDGGWVTIKSWNSTGGTRAELSKSYSVSSGYSYRLKTTHRAYNSSGSLVESIEKYSSTITY